jgi:hypothetical protein
MHLQIRSTVTKAGSGAGARNADEGAGGVTIARPGRLLRLLDILAEDHSLDGRGDGLPGFSLASAAGSGIETTGQFIFSVVTDEDNDAKDHQAALDRIKPEFPASEIVERMHADLPHRAGALRDYVAKFAEDDLLIDEIVIGVATLPTGGTEEDIHVPLQVHALQTLV